MPINFDSALGVHEDALLLRAKRSEVIANNIANADTPNFKARDMDFEAALREAQAPTQMKQVTTHSGHMQGFIGEDAAADLMYRIPNQPSLDGNTVELQEEMARFTDNAVRFQSSFTMLNSKFVGLKKAIKGD